MNFEQFDSRGASDKPRPLHLKHPGTGELLYETGANGKPDNGKPCRVLVLGIEGAVGQGAVLASQRAKMSATPTPGEPTPLSEIHDGIVKEITPLIVSFENISRGERPAEAPQDVEWFLTLQLVTGSRGQLSFAEQVRSFAIDRASILGNGQASSA